MILADLVITHDWTLYIAVFACAFAVSMLTTPLAKKLSVRFNAIDYPRHRGMHAEPMPRMGGIAIVLGFLASMAVMLFFIGEMRSLQFAGFITGGIILVVLGALDDIHTLSWKIKLPAQFLAAFVAVLTGTRVEFVFFPINTLLDPFGIPFTVIWIVALTNAVNWIDGLDGLAAGVSAIGAVCLLILCLFSGSVVAVVMSAALAGSCLGFLPRNFNPAEVIMGDTGALFLGYVLAVSSIMGVFKVYALLAVVTACFALALPVFDMVVTIARRIMNKKSPFEADRGHLHHQLVDAGLSPLKAVAVMYSVSVVAGAVAIVLAFRDARAIIVTVVCIVIMSSMVYVYTKRPKNEAKAPYRKFDGKASIYAAHRPSYPAEFIDYLYSSVLGRAPETIADIGSGTGKLTKLLAEKGGTVYAVEPNDGMRKIAEEELSGFEGFRSVKGMDARTGLGGSSVDLVTAAQAFHWFDRNKFKEECRRILKPGGKVVLVWNNKDVKSDAGLEIQETNRRYCPGYTGFAGGMDLTDNTGEFDSFFAGAYEAREFENDLVLSEQDFVGSALSSSGAPKEGDADYAPYIGALKEIFAKYGKDGAITIPNKTKSYAGSV